MNVGKLIDGMVHIKSRLNNFKDLELIICANQALKSIRVKSYPATPTISGTHVKHVKTEKQLL